MKQNFLNTDTSNKIQIGKLASAKHPSPLRITVLHETTANGGKTTLQIYFSRQNGPSTIQLETTPNYAPLDAIKRWQGLINDMGISAQKTGRNITLLDLCLSDKGKIVQDKLFNGTETSSPQATKDDSRTAFMKIVRDYMLKNANRRIEPNKSPRPLNKRSLNFQGLVAK